MVEEGGTLTVHGVHCRCLCRSLAELKDNFIVSISEFAEDDKSILVNSFWVYVLL